MLGEMEEVEVAAESAVVPRARLLQPLEMGVEVGLRVERGAVDPRQLGVLLVAAPVRAGEARQLERLDRGGVLQVRAAAEVGEVALGVERDRALGLARKLDLVRLGLRLEPRECLVSRDLLARPAAAFGDLTPHLLLDRSKVVLGDRLRELEVVVEAVGDRGSDRDLDTGMEPQDGLREQVRGRVPQYREGVGVLRVPRRQELDLLSVRERKAKVPRRRRSRGRAPPARRASGRSRAPRRARTRRREARARTNRGARLSSRGRIRVERYARAVSRNITGSTATARLGQAVA